MAYHAYKQYNGPVRNPALQVYLTEVKIIDDRDGLWKGAGEICIHISIGDEIAFYFGTTDQEY